MKTRRLVLIDSAQQRRRLKGRCIDLSLRRFMQMLYAGCEFYLESRQHVAELHRALRLSLGMVDAQLAFGSLSDTVTSQDQGQITPFVFFFGLQTVPNIEGE